jgi:glyoxylase-like metal-dependent hydrolase (beta-lactamase superfamily II)
MAPHLHRTARLAFSALVAAICLLPAPNASAGTADRLYVIDCGFAHAADQSLWSPGVNAGVPIDFSDNCYLVHHSREGYLLWDTGITDRLAAARDGASVPALRQTWHRGQTLVTALAALGVKPADVRYVALSHVHPDHAGNVDAFPDATLIIQKAEWDYAMSLPQPPFRPDRKAELIAGDKDLFGDGSAVLLSTPGHTPGHQSLLLRLPKTGTVLLSGDAVHFQDNWDNRRVPGFNADRDQTVASMQRIADFLAREQAKLWINHDKPSSDARRHAPEFYE